MSFETIADVIRSGHPQPAAPAEPAAPVAETPVVPPVAEPVAPPAETAEKPAENAEAEQKAMTFKACSVDDQGVIVLIGSAADIEDRDKETVEKGAVLRMAFDFCAGATRTFKANHDHEIACDLVASWPGSPVLKSGRLIESGEKLPDDDPVVAINIEKGRESHWFVGVRPHDPEVLKAAREGKLGGASWGGWATKQ